MKAVTTKEITGRCIPSIPIGTEFEVTSLGFHASFCKGLGINQIWNTEYRIAPEETTFYDLKVGTEFVSSLEKTKTFIKLGDRIYCSVDKCGGWRRGSDNYKIATYTARRWLVIKTN